MLDIARVADEWRALPRSEYSCLLDAALPPVSQGWLKPAFGRKI